MVMKVAGSIPDRTAHKCSFPEQELIPKTHAPSQYELTPKTHAPSQYELIPRHMHPLSMNTELI